MVAGRISEFVVVVVVVFSFDLYGLVHGWLVRLSFVKIFFSLEVVFAISTPSFTFILPLRLTWLWLSTY